MKPVSLSSACRRASPLAYCSGGYSASTLAGSPPVAAALLSRSCSVGSDAPMVNKVASSAFDPMRTGVVGNVPAVA